MIGTPTRLLALWLCVAALGAAALPAPAPAAARSRLLDRAIGSAFDEGDRDRVARAFRAAEQGGVDERAAAELVRLGIEGGFGPEELVRILSLATQLALEDLPVDAFVAKIEEGVAKGVRAERVIQAAESRALGLNQAKGLVNAAVLDGLEVGDREELVADVAGALEAGRSPEAVREVFRRAKDEALRPREMRRLLFP